MWIHQDDGRTFGMCFGYGVIKSFFQNILHLTVNSQIDCWHLWWCRTVKAAFAYFAPKRVQNFAPMGFRTFNNRVQSPFYAAQSIIINTDKTENMCSHRILGIITFTFFQKMQSGKLIIFDYLPNCVSFCWFHRPFDPEEATAIAEITI
ncbi:hypothetical protein SDC9_134395 [bioreactor metagenome]|uniref:Uncharacterized protein n=1 Tax=bioreactor metagenome TaxID=1076179 RepID=A0A645DDH7_9ZZZZ